MLKGLLSITWESVIEYPPASHTTLSVFCLVILNYVRFIDRTRLIHVSVPFFTLLLLPRLLFTTLNNQQKPFIFQDNSISTHCTRQLKHHVSCEIFCLSQVELITSSFVPPIYLIKCPSSFYFHFSPFRFSKKKVMFHLFPYP